MSDSSGDEENFCTPPELGEAARKLCGNLLPPKSREKYQYVYNTFKKWMKTKKAKGVTENVLLAYFSELSEKYKPPTLWSTYSMLRSTFNINEKIDLQDYKQLIAFLKRQSSGYIGKKSKVFTAEQMKTFLDTAPDVDYLAAKVALIFGISGACRGAELINLTVDDVTRCKDVVVVKLKNTKNKTNRNFTIEGEFMKKIHMYQDLRPQKMTATNRFFLCYRNGHCTKQVMGKNKLGGIPKDIAKFLNLTDTELYTGHSFRRSAATLCADTGADITQIKRLGGWKSTTVAEGYIDESIGHKRKTGQQISNAIGMASSSFSSLSFEEPAKRPRLNKKDEENDEEIVELVDENQNLLESSMKPEKHSITINVNNSSNISFRIGK